MRWATSRSSTVRRSFIPLEARQRREVRRRLAVGSRDWHVARASYHEEFAQFVRADARYSGNDPGERGRNRLIREWCSVVSRDYRHLEELSRRTRYDIEKLSAGKPDETPEHV